MKKIIAFIAACALTGAVFAGCGGNNNASKTETTTAAATTQAPTEAATEAATQAATQAAADVSGQWVSSLFVTAENESLTPTEYAEKYEISEDDVIGVYDFKEDGKVSYTLLGTTVEGTYTFDGTKLTATFPETSATVVLEYSAEQNMFASKDEATGITVLYAKTNATEDVSTADAEEATQAETAPAEE